MAQNHNPPGHSSHEHEKASGHKSGQGGQPIGEQHSSGNFAEDREKAAEAGRKGGQHSSGNFAEDREKAAEAGRKGGQHSPGNFAEDKEKASEAGRKGGSK